MTEDMWLSLLAPGGLLVVIAGGIFAAVHTRKARNRDAVTEVIREQVQNSHGTNLRDDVDRLIAGIDAIGSDVRGMRRDLGRLDTRDIERGREIRDLTHKVDKHLEWSAAWSDEREAADRDAAKRIGDIEDTLNPAKEK